MVNNKSTILLTGINGFLGSNLAKRLTLRYKVIGLETEVDNVNRIRDYLNKIEVYKNDLASIENIYANRKIDIIIHTATSFGRNGETLTQIANTNYFSPLLLLEKAISYRTKVFINTDTVINKYINSYSLFKRHFYESLQFNKDKIKAINIKLEHFYGTDASTANFITAISKKLLNNEKFIELTKGEQKRDFIYIDDVVNAFEKIVDNSINEKNNANEYHICTGEIITIKEIVELLKQLTNSKSILKFGAIPYREFELMETELDNSAIRSLGWESTISLYDGLVKTINYMKNKSENYQ